MPWVVFALASIAMLTGCSSVNGMFGGNSPVDALGKLKWGYQERSIDVVWSADRALNSHGETSHTLLLAILQCTDPNVFRAYVTEPEKLATLLSAKTVPQGFLQVDRVFVQPGSDGAISLARAQNAQYVGVIAGYYTLEPARVARLYQIGVSVDSRGFLIKTRTASPALLQINLQLGPDGLLGGESSRALPPAPVQPKAGEVPLTEPSPKNTTSGVPYSDRTKTS